MESESPDDGGSERRSLLEFVPVPRRCERRDGWLDERQRDYIALLALIGEPNRAAHAVGRTARGAYQLRRDAGGEDFARAWDAALAFHEAWTAPPAAATAPPPPPPSSQQRSASPGSGETDGDPDLEWEAFVDGLLGKYLMKLDMEREARISGRIIEADYYVRQLTWLEVALDLGGNAHALLMQLRRGGRHAGEIAATPMSVLLDSVRRAYWNEEGGPERPALPALGFHDGAISTGEPLECQHWPERDGDHKQWQQGREEKAAIAAEAQAAWEEKARADAEAWRKREEGAGDAGEAERRP